MALGKATVTTTDAPSILASLSHSSDSLLQPAVDIWECFGAGLPFIIVNTLCGALAAYGFAGLRYTPAAILLYSVILVLQSLIAIQVMVFCVYVSASQVRALPSCRLLQR